MKILDAANFYKTLNKYSKMEHFNALFAFKMGVNLERLLPIAREVQKRFDAESTPKIDEMEKKVNTLVREYYVLNEKGRPVSIKPEFKDAYELAIKNLNDEYKEEIENYNKRVLDTENKLINEEVNVSLETVEISEFPQNSPPQMFKDLMPMINKPVK